jgi:hypothetical protein
MAKYQRQGTNKYYGAANAGYVSSGSSVDGLAKSLTNAGYQIGKAETLRIDRKKDKAIAKIDELYANGKSFETIQAEIISGNHPELTGKYIDATTNYHAGKVKAHEVITNIKANKDKYDITDESNSLELFYKQYMPDTKAMDTSTLLGFTTHFNKFKSVDALNDAENRAAYNSEKKVMEGTQLLSDIPLDTLKKDLPEFLKSLQIPVPMRDGTGSTLLYTNAETLAVVRRSIVDIIANAKTEADLDRAEILMNTNLGYSKSGSAIGTLASRKSKEVLAIQDQLTIKRRNLETQDREEAEYQRKQKVKSIYARLYSPVTETDENGNTTERDLTHTEKMALRDELEAMGDVAAVGNFDKAMIADLYINDDPAIVDDFITKIYSDGFADVEEMKEAFNDLDTDPRKMGAMLDHYENSQKDDNKKLHINNLAYSSGSTAIMNIVGGAFDLAMNGGNPKVQAQAESNVKRYVIREIYDFENDFFKREGRKPDNDERDAFMVKLEKYVSKQFAVAPNTMSAIKPLASFDDQKKIEDQKALEEKNKLEAEEAAEIKKEETRQDTGFYNTFNTAVSQIPNVTLQTDKFDDMSITINGEKLNFPQIEQHRTNNDNFPFNSISQEDFNKEEVVPFIQQVVSSFFPDGTLNKEFFDLIPQDRGVELIKDLSKQLGIEQDLIIQALEGLAK